MDVLNYRLTFCVLICQAGTPFGTNCAKLWVHFHGPWIAEVPNDFCLLAVSNLSTALKLWMQLKRNTTERNKDVEVHTHTRTLHGRTRTHFTETLEIRRASLKKRSSSQMLQRLCSIIKHTHTQKHTHTHTHSKELTDCSWDLKKAFYRNMRSQLQLFMRHVLYWS